MIKSLVKLLKRDQTQGEGEQSAFASETTESAYSTKQLRQLWSITLDSLKSKTIVLTQLIDACVLEEMIEAFLKSSEEIKQTTFLKIL